MSIPAWLDVGYGGYIPLVVLALGIGALAGSLVPILIAKRAGPDVYRQFIEEMSRLPERDATKMLWGVVVVGVILLVLGIVMTTRFATESLFKT
jgi:hypothetical protein